MTATLLVLRPEPGASATAARIAARGVDAVVSPLFEVRPLPWEAPPPEDFDALLLTSAQAARHGGTALGQYHSLPLYAVGAATAAAGACDRLRRGDCGRSGRGGAGRAGGNGRTKAPAPPRRARAPAGRDRRRIGCDEARLRRRGGGDTAGRGDGGARGRGGRAAPFATRRVPVPRAGGGGRVGPCRAVHRRDQPGGAGGSGRRMGRRRRRRCTDRCRAAGCGVCACAINAREWRADGDRLSHDRRAEPTRPRLAALAGAVRARVRRRPPPRWAMR